MQTLPASFGLLVSLSLFAGCAATTPGLGHDAGSTSLPSGLRLLDSDESECSGTVQLGEESIDGHGSGLQGAFVVESGENATYELSPGYDDVEWACVGAGSPRVQTMTCPRGATHVRITRANTGGDLLFECYG